MSTPNIATPISAENVAIQLHKWANNPFKTDVLYKVEAVHLLNSWAGKQLDAITDQLAQAITDQLAQKDAEISAMTKDRDGWLAQSQKPTDNELKYLADLTKLRFDDEMHRSALRNYAERDAYWQKRAEQAEQQLEAMTDHLINAQPYIASLGVAGKWVDNCVQAALDAARKDAP